jgi:hypothetical protein
MAGGPTRPRLYSEGPGLPSSSPRAYRLRAVTIRARRFASTPEASRSSASFIGLVARILAVFCGGGLPCPCGPPPTPTGRWPLAGFHQESRRLLRLRISDLVHFRARARSPSAVPSRVARAYCERDPSRAKRRRLTVFDKELAEHAHHAEANISTRPLSAVCDLHTLSAGADRRLPLRSLVHQVEVRRNLPSARVRRSFSRRDPRVTAWCPACAGRSPRNARARRRLP